MKGLARTILALFFLFALVLPLTAIARRVESLSSFLDPVFIRMASFTFRQALLSSALAALIGVPLGVFVGRAGRARVTQVTRTLLSIPFAIPTVVAASAWVSLLGRSGILASLGLSLDWAYTLKAVVLAHVFLNAPWIALNVSYARQTLDPALTEAARTLGAGPLLYFRSVLWPQIRWSVFSSTAQVLSLCSLSFALVLILGGGPPVETLETGIFSRLRYDHLDLSAAAGCALWELLITLIPWAIFLFAQSRARSWTVSSQSVAFTGRRASGGKSGMVLAMVALAFVVPYLTVFRGAAFSSLEDVGQALSVSLVIALLSSLGALGLACIALLAGTASNAIALAMAIPGGVSAIVIGLGFWLAYEKWIDPFSGSLFAIIAVQVTLFTPLVYRMLLPVARAPQIRIVEAALTLGASRARAYLSVEWPRWRGPLRASFAIVIAASLGELAAVSLFYSEGTAPLPLLLSQWMRQYRFEDAQGVAAILFLLCVTVIGSVQLLEDPFESVYR